jgi:hypothetical protein
MDHRDRWCPACDFARHPGGWLGEHTNPILRPEAVAAVKKYIELVVSGTVAADLHNSCWPEPPPFVMALHFGVNIVPRRDEVTLLYLLNNTVRHVRLDAQHPENPAPSWQGHSVGWYEGDTLVVDTVGIKVAPFSTVDAFGTPHSKALHVVERYRLIDGGAAAEIQRKHGAIPNRVNTSYGLGVVDPDTTKNGLQVEFTVEESGHFHYALVGTDRLSAPHWRLAGSGLRRESALFGHGRRDSRGAHARFLNGNRLGGRQAVRQVVHADGKGAVTGTDGRGWCRCRRACGAGSISTTWCS